VEIEVGCSSGIAAKDARHLGRRIFSVLILLFGASTFVCNSTPAGQEPADAQQTVQSQPTKKPNSESEEKKDERKKKEKRGAFVAAPLPLSSPAIGSGIIPVVGYIFPFSTKDKISPPSVVGAAGLVTNNGSRGFAVGGQLYMKENTYRVTAGFARGNVDYNVYGIGIASDQKLPLNQTGHAFFGEALRRIWWKFFIGPRVLTGDSFITVTRIRAAQFPSRQTLGFTPR
jgi:hypothetical protein